MTKMAPLAKNIKKTTGNENDFIGAFAYARRSGSNDTIRDPIRRRIRVPLMV